MITKAKKGGLHNHRQIVAFIGDKEIAAKLIDEIGPRYADRPGGYTRILKLGPRQGDNAPMAQHRTGLTSAGPPAPGPPGPAHVPLFDPIGEPVAGASAPVRLHRPCADDRRLRRLDVPRLRRERRACPPSAATLRRGARAGAAGTRSSSPVPVAPTRGVHARGQVVTFDAAGPTSTSTGCSERQRLLGAGRSWSARPAVVAPDFDARFSATLADLPLHGAQPGGARSRSSAAPPGTSPQPLDLAALRRGVPDPLLGAHDFSSFCRRQEGGQGRGAGLPRPPGARRPLGRARGTICCVFEIEATAFCHQMVRSIVGTLVDVGSGPPDRRPTSWPRSPPGTDAAAGQLAPPHGLCLWEVRLLTAARVCGVRALPCAVSSARARRLRGARTARADVPAVVRDRRIETKECSACAPTLAKASEIERAWYVVDADGPDPRSHGHRGRRGSCAASTSPCTRPTWTPATT